MTDDEIITELRRAADRGARPVEVVERLVELAGGLSTDNFLFYMRRAFPGIPADFLFGRGTAWLRLGDAGPMERKPDKYIDELLGKWVSGEPSQHVREFAVGRAERVGSGELLHDGQLVVVPTFGSERGGDEFAIVVVDGITVAVFQRPRLALSPPRWLDACVFITTLRETEESVTFDIHVDGAVTTALACFAGATALVTSGHRQHDPMIATDPEGREYWAHIRATPNYEHGWCGDVEWDLEGSTTKA